VVNYTKAITLNPHNAVYFANRAFAHMRMENNGSAVADATKAIELDPKYIKAYYRRADANFAMGKIKQSLKDFKRAAKVAPKDPDLKRKLAACEKAVKKLRFEEALHMPGAPVVLVSEQIVLEDMIVEDGYAGPRLEVDGEGRHVVTLGFVRAMLEEFREQRQIHRRYAFAIILQALELFKAAPTLVDLTVEEGKHITVCGDTNGQYYDLLNIFELNGLPLEENPYLFNGDFVDRGSFSAEVILALFSLKVLYPTAMYMSRGNHETTNMNKIYGFQGEVKAKFSVQMGELFKEAFNWLPLAHVLNGKVFVVHGGLFTKDGVTLDEIRALDRNREPPDEGIMCEALWSDPQEEPGRSPSKRGVGVAFGPDVTKSFLRENGLQLLVRSHEVRDEGYDVMHDGYCITVFSAPNYCDQMGNKGAFIRFEHDMVPHFTTYAHVPHPTVRPMAYAGGFMSQMAGF